jgi:2,4-dienoyl-CoA reductase-like NADH-dependent reductase (Old Yellow Enzyme family)
MRDVAPATGPSARFPHLFSPVRVGPLTLANRILSSGHDTVMADDGLVTDQLVAYHEARAAGGVGLIVIQATAVHPSADYTAHTLAVYDDRAGPGLRRLADAVHAHDVPIFGQLFHGGREVMDTRDGTLAVALAPSNVPNERFHVMPKSMSAPEIRDIVAAYGTAAARFRAAGFDGVEIVASHGYLPAQFLNPRVNLRTDAYGGRLDGRLRFLREVLAAVRSALDGGVVVGLRISVDEWTSEGLVPDESLAALAALDADGSLDYVSVVAGTSATLGGSDHIVPAMHETNAYTAPLAARARAVVRVPVMVAGRINQPQEAEAVIAAGQADLCAMTRALISDPLLPRKAAEGRLDEIRACVACNQACIGHFHAGYPISCIQYPESGREREYGRRSRVAAGAARRVLVVGGGPAGLKAAAVAAERGHRVTLVEGARRVGGQVRLAERIPGRAEFGGVVTNLEGEARRAGVEIVVGTLADAAFVSSFGAQAVILATGATPRRPALELSGSAVVLDAWQVLDDPSRVPDGHVVVADWRCDWIGAGLAELLARRGHRVTLGVTGYMPGQVLQQYVRDHLLGTLQRLPVTIVPNVRIFGYDGRAAFFEHVLNRAAVVVDDAASLVLAQGHLPAMDLADALADGPTPPFELASIGDCLAPRTVEEAVLDGLRVGAAL